MKATLEFDLESYDDRQEHLRCVKSTDMAISLFEITHNMKRSLPEDCTVDDVLSKIYEILSEQSIDIDELIS